MSNSLLLPDGRTVAPWERGIAGARPGAVAAPARQVAAAPRQRAGDAPRSEPLEGGAAHPLAEPALSAALKRRAEEIEDSFSRIEPVLARLAPRQFDDGFAERAHQELASSLGVDIPADDLESSWSAPLDLGCIHARCVLGTFTSLVEREFDRNLARLAEGESAEVLIPRFGFHAVDITTCADGRLGGAVDYVLRVPPAVVVWHDAYAGAMFDVEDALHQWEAVELRRWREGWPNDASEPTRYLKIGMYHFSSLDPANQGCAAHDSDEERAASALLTRLREFEGAVESAHCCGAEVATLLVGLDTDTDAIRVHVPDAAGGMEVERFVSSATLYESTANLEREAAKEFIREAVAACAGVDASDDATEGIRWLCGYLLKNNLGQVHAVRGWNGGRYPDAGHGERLIVAGDGMDDVQVRNLAFQAQMRTLEEGAVDLDVGIGILRRANAPRGLGVPVLVHVTYDERIPDASTRSRARARRLTAAIEARYADETSSAGIVTQAVVRARGRSRLEVVEPEGDDPVSVYGAGTRPKETHR